ncbi:MAG TPA: hypothetical protein VKI61_08035 [Chitinophagaceae bacterium]|jgi:hypothetical protein|nr:hypothetical protein [Chitinophagaceae bacterium]
MFVLIVIEMVYKRNIYFNIPSGFLHETALLLDEPGTKYFHQGLLVEHVK